MLQTDGQFGWYSCGKFQFNLITTFRPGRNPNVRGFVWFERQQRRGAKPQYSSDPETDQLYNIMTHRPPWTKSERMRHGMPDLPPPLTVCSISFSYVYLLMSTQHSPRGLPGPLCLKGLRVSSLVGTTERRIGLACSYTQQVIPPTPDRPTASLSTDLH